MQSVEDYIASVPQERMEAFLNIRKAILDNIPLGFEETINYKMIGYVVPHRLYPNGYHCDTSLPLPFCNLASQKSNIALYHMGIYSNPELLQWFQKEYKACCKYKLDMGKSCIRFKRLDDIPFDLVGELMSKVSVKEWIETYESTVKDSRKKTKA